MKMISGPFFLAEVDGKEMIVDAAARVADHSAVRQIIVAGANLVGWSPGQIDQQHSDIGRDFQRRGGR